MASLKTFDSILNYLPLRYISTTTHVEILERLRKGSVSTVALTAFLGYTTYLVLFKYHQIHRSREWHALPFKGGWDLAYDIFTNKGSVIDRYKKHFKPLLEKEGILRAQVLVFDTMVVVASPEYAKEIFLRPDDFLKLEPSTRGGDKSSLPNRFFDTSIVFSNGDTWRRHRKIANPAFHRSWDTTVFGDCTIIMAEEILKEGAGGVGVDIQSLSQRLTLDALGKAAFAFDFESLRYPDGPYVEAYNKSFGGIQIPLYHIAPFLDKPWGKRAEAYKALDKLDTLLFDIIDKKKAHIKAKGDSNDSKVDLLTMMIQATDAESDGKGLSTQELRNNLLIFFLAGHDTTANALSSAMYFLAKHPEIQKKARQEIINVMGDEAIDRVPTIEETKEFPYLSMIIKETMRLSPSVAQLPDRRTARDTTIGQHFIPAKTPVSINIYSMHLNPKYWGEDADEFKPERWEDGTLEKRNVYTYVPFSYGSRACIGTNFSLIEQRVVLSMLIRKFEWTLPADSPHKDGLRYGSGIVISPVNLRLNFKALY